MKAIRTVDGRIVLAGFFAMTPLVAYAVLGGQPSYANATNTTTVVLDAGTLSPAGASNPGVASGSMGETGSTDVPDSYFVRQTRLPGGTAVREFTGADGVVFAIAWTGPRMPDLRMLLGSRFSAYIQGVDDARSGRPGVALRDAVAVSPADVVVMSGGHPGAFHGLAYLGDRLPAGMAPADLH